LQPAVSVFGAIGAIEIMMAEQKLKSGISQSFNFWRIQVYYHAIADRLSARGDRGAPAFYFHKAETAGSKGCGCFSNGAKVGNIKSIIQGNPEYIGSFPGLDLDAINR
jgi:hypothetical protein